MPGFDAPAEDGAEMGAGGFDPFAAIGGLFSGLGGPSDVAGGKEPASKPKTPRARMQYAREKVERLVSVADGVVQQLVDRSAAMTPQERDMIVPPLAELVAESKELARVAGLSNSISLVVGVGLWSFRIIAVWRYKHPPKPADDDASGLVQPANPLPGIAMEDDLIKAVREDLGASKAFIIPNGATGDLDTALHSMVHLPVNDFGAGGPTGQPKRSTRGNAAPS